MRIAGFVALLATASALPATAIAHPHRRHHKRHHHQRPSHAARAITWGSSLEGAPTATIPGNYAQDAEFWLTQLGSPAVGGVQHVAVAPVSGRVVSVRLKVGDDADA